MRFDSPDQLQIYAGSLADQYTKILLHGDLGAGKTTFVKGFVQGLGIPASLVSSPTYTYINTYQHPEKDLRILHIDMYRIKSYEQMVELGIEELIDQYEWVIIEWPKWEEEYVDEGRVKILIEKVSETTRELICEKHNIAR